MSALASASCIRFRKSAFVLALSLIFLSACTIYGDKPARAIEEATGGEALEKLFWKNVQAKNWAAVDRSLASNYVGVSATGKLDRAVTVEQYKNWQLADFSIGDLQTELNGTTIVVTFTITLNGTSSAPGAGSQALPSSPQHMMTVWQQQKKGWIVIAHSSAQ